MALNTCEMWFNGIKIAFFSKNLQKSPSGWGLCPQTPIATGGDTFDIPPAVWYVWVQCDTFEYNGLLSTSPKLGIFTFKLLVFTLSFTKILVKYQQDYSFRSSILRYLCPTKSSYFEIFWWRHCMWFVVWAPPIKNPGYAYVLVHALCNFVFTVYE